MKLELQTDPTLCVSCGACAVACMDQNDLETEGRNPFLVMRKADCSACALRLAHGLELPCRMICPTGALRLAERA